MPIKSSAPATTILIKAPYSKGAPVAPPSEKDIDASKQAFLAERVGQISSALAIQLLLFRQQKRFGDLIDMHIARKRLQNQAGKYAGR